MAFQAGALSIVSVTQVGDVLSSAVAVSGTTPYSYQWYRSTSSGFSPGTANILSGQTSLGLTDINLTPNTVYYYLVVATDSSGTPVLATSAQLMVTTLASTFSALPVSTIVNISVATPQQGIGAYNTSNLSIFTRESYASSFGSLGYKIYLSPIEVGIDFGTASATYAMANAVFSQQPNILQGGGYLVIIPFLASAQVAVQDINFLGGTGVAASGSFVLSYNGNPTSALQWNASAAAIQTALRLLSGLGSVVVTGSIAAGLVVTFNGVSGPASLLTVSSNTLLDVNSVAVVPTPVTVVIGSSAETLDAAILRTQGLIQYFGVMAAEITPQTVMLAAAAEIQALNKLAFFTSFTQGDVGPGGMLDLLRSGGFTQSRAVPYFETLVSNQPVSSLKYMAAYASLGLSVNFNGSNTTITTHLKTLAGVQPDPSMNPTLYNLCQAAGADVYASVQGVPKVLCSGTNDFYDNQYNLQWLVGALQVAGFNYLATVATKVPQTENGMSGLKGAYRQVCEQGVTNQFIAPGSWNSATTFGNQQDLIQNVAQRGYYIYSTPISQQLQAVRVLRQAPLVQIAIKYAGALHSSTVIVNINP